LAGEITRSDPKKYAAGEHGMEGAIADIYRKQAGIAPPAVTPKPTMSIATAFKEGIQHRTSWTDILKDDGADDATAAILGGGLDIFVDPSWLVTPFKVLSLAGKPVSAVIKGLREVAATKPLIKGMDDIIGRVAEGLAKQGFATTEKMRRYKEVARTARDALQTIKNECTDFTRELTKKVPAAERKVITAFIDLGAPVTKPLGKKTTTVMPAVDVAGKEMGRVRQPEKFVAAARLALLDNAADAGMDVGRIQSYAARAMELDNNLGRGLVKAGLMSEETRKLWQGGHIRRAYLMFEDTQAYINTVKDVDPKAAMLLQSLKDAQDAIITGSKPARGARAIAPRKDIVEAARVKMGEITDAGYLFGRGSSIALEATERAMVQKAVADTFAIPLNAVTEAQAMGLRVFPDVPAWGALAGKAVPEAIFRDMNYFARNPKTTFMRWVSAWKFGKVIANLATWSRNIYSTLLQNDAIAGLPIYRLDIYANAAKDILTKSPMWQEVRNAGTLFESTLTQAELGNLMKALDTAKTPAQGFRGVAQALTNMGKTGAGLAGRGYQFIEQWGKMSAYRFARLEGKAVEEAVKLAEKAGFNYADVPRWVEHFRSGRAGIGTVPFLTYPYKAIPAMAEAALKNPARITRWFKTTSAVETLKSDIKADAERKYLPGYAQSGSWVRLPIEDDEGNHLWLDMTYILPMSDLNETAHLTSTGAQPGFASFPFFDVVADLTRNQSRFTGKPLYPKGATRPEITKAVVQYIVDFLAPPMVTRNLRNVMDAWKGIPTWDGRKQSVGWAVAGAVAGIRTRAFNLPDEYANRIREIDKKIRDTQYHLADVLSDPRLSEKAKETVFEDAMKQIDAYVDALEALTSEGGPEIPSPQTPQKNTSPKGK
jgi:hypothetical protein